MAETLGARRVLERTGAGLGNGEHDLPHLPTESSNRFERMYALLTASSPSPGARQWLKNWAPETSWNR